MFVRDTMVRSVLVLVPECELDENPILFSPRKCPPASAAHRLHEIHGVVGDPLLRSISLIVGVIDSELYALPPQRCMFALALDRMWLPIDLPARHSRA